ncbi:osmotically inducible protein OsmC [candidate division KSB1 bacterium]|nr:MAG: osmotically inducible protein OsmC [candidate division KSB1 bacterium]
MKAALKWEKDSLFRGENENGITIALDGCNKEGLEPMALLLLSLGGSTGMNVINILNKMQVNYTDLSLQIEGERYNEEPGHFRKITLRYILKGNKMMRDKFKRAIDLSMKKYCSVLHSLDKRIGIKIEYCIVDN